MSHKSRFQKKYPLNSATLNEHGLSGNSFFSSNIDTNAYKQNEIINLLLRSHFQGLKDKIINENISYFIPLKGLSLLDQVYERIGERQITDIDILISENDLEIITKLLFQDGYVLKETNSKSYKYNFLKKTKNIDIDLEIHTRLFSHIKNNIFEQNILENKLSLELECIYMCYHLAEQHNFLKLKWLYDIYLFWNKWLSQINIEKMLILSKSLGVERSLYTTFYCLQYYFELPEHFQCELPKSVEEKLKWDFLIQNQRRSKDHFLIKKYLKKDRFYKYIFSWFFHKD